MTPALAPLLGMVHRAGCCMKVTDVSEAIPARLAEQGRRLTAQAGRSAMTTFLVQYLAMLIITSN
jgi:hypothetical protein